MSADEVFATLTTSDACRRDPLDLLSPELWARVLVQLRGNETGSATGAEDHEQLFERQQELLNLRLVCRLFKVLYDSEPHFISNLLLPDRFSIASIPSMIAWLQKHTANIQSVPAVFGSPFLEAILTGLYATRQT